MLKVYITIIIKCQDSIKKAELFPIAGFAAENSLLEMIDSEKLILVLSAMQEIMNMGMEQTKEVFLVCSMPMVMRVLLPTIRWSMMRDLR